MLGPSVCAIPIGFLDRPDELRVAGRALEPSLCKHEALPLDRPETDPLCTAWTHHFRARLALHAVVVVTALRRQAELAHESLPAMIVMARSPMMEVAGHMRHLVRYGAVEALQALVAEHVERELDVATGGHGQAGGRAKPSAQFDARFRTNRLAQSLFTRTPPVADALLRQAFPIGTEDGDGSARHAFWNG